MTEPSTRAYAMRSDPGLLTLHRNDLLRTEAFVAGVWRGSESGRVFRVLNPADGGLIAEVADCGPELARAAVDAACAAFADWRAAPAGKRSSLLRRWFELVEANGEDLARLLSWEQGKPLAEARGEVAYGGAYLEWFAEEAKRGYGEIIPGPAPGRQPVVLVEPVGVAGVITPWNFPIAMIARKFAPALAAGCTVVAKPAAETPLSALALAALAEEAGIPAGVINLVPTQASQDVGAAWLADPRVRKISFTGSTRVGKLLAAQGSDTLKRLSLELGGDAPFIVFEDADLDRAVAGLMQAKFRNAGQACIAANRVYVQDAIYDLFLDRIVDAVSRLTVGSATRAAADIGPLIKAEAAAQMQALTRDAVAKGARLLTGGGPHPAGPLFFQPTVLADVSSEMRLSCEEIFGPILAVRRFRDEAAAIALANDSPYGLAAYVFSGDLARAWRIAGALETGMVGVNEGAISNAAAPFGGVKESGYGREGSRHGLADYQNLKYVCLGGLG